MEHELHNDKESVIEMDNDPNLADTSVALGDMETDIHNIS